MSEESKLDGSSGMTPYNSEKPKESKMEKKGKYFIHEICDPIKYKTLKTILVDEENQIFATVGIADGTREVCTVRFTKNYLTEEGIRNWLDKNLHKIPELLADAAEKRTNHRRVDQDEERSSARAWKIRTKEADGHWHMAEVYIENSGDEAEMVVGKTFDTVGETPSHSHELDTGMWGFQTSPSSDGDGHVHAFDHPTMVQECLPLEEGEYKFKLHRRIIGEDVVLKLRIQTWSKKHVLSYDITSWTETLKQIPIGNINVVNKAWFDFEGEIPAGNPGASKDEKATYELIDEGVVEFGTRKEYFHEYFFQGELLKGRVIFNREGWSEKSRWFMNQTNVSIPYVMQDKAMKNGWAPQRGWSCLPKEWKSLIPDSFKYWNSETPDIMRDQLLDRVKKQEIVDDSGVEIKNRTSYEFIFRALSKI